MLAVVAQELFMPHFGIRPALVQRSLAVTHQERSSSRTRLRKERSNGSKEEKEKFEQHLTPMRTQIW